MKVKITADSTCDLPQAFLDRYGIRIFPLYIVRDGVALRDGIDITPDDLYAYTKETGKLCGTAASTVADYADGWRECLKDCDAVVHVAFSSELSVTCGNARLAAEDFGNVYVSNTTEGETPDGNVGVGIYEYSPNGDNISSSDVSAGIEWTGVAGQGPRRIAVAADGRIFAADYSTENAGIYVIDPDTWTGTPLFKDAVNDGNGSLTVNGTYVGGRMVAVGVRGEGESTQLYAADATASGASWKKFVNRYDIGTASEWSTAPSYSAAASSYIGNENSSIVPVSTGFWAAQFRGQGSSSVANPCLFYFSDEQGDAVYDTSEIDDKESSNGALAVDEKTGTVAHSFGGGVRVFHYRLNYEGIPQVELLFEKPLDQTPLNSFAFDYAGNLYVVSGDGKLGIYGMPTNDNSITVPAKDYIVFGFDSVEELESAAKASVYPNPASDVATVTAGCPIERIAIYNAASGAEALNVAGNGQNEMTIDVAGLSKGVYIVRINNVHTLKLIKR